MRFDAMHAVTGPYAQEIFERRLGAPPAQRRHGDAAAPISAAAIPIRTRSTPSDLMAAMFARRRARLRRRARDGDGDRNMIVGRRFVVTPSDSLAVLAANAHLVPGYAKGSQGIARSMPTSRAADRVAAALGIACYETPTGWKFFGNLLDAGLVDALRRGERRHRLGPRAREGRPVGGAVLAQHPRRAAGRVGRVDRPRPLAPLRPRLSTRATTTKAIDAAAASALIARPARAARVAAGPIVRARRRRPVDVVGADDFAYTDPVDGSVTTQQGIRIVFDDDARIVFRLSGTGTEGATLRIYLERFEPDPARQGVETQAALAPLIAIADRIAGVRERTGRDAPSVMT